MAVGLVSSYRSPFFVGRRRGSGLASGTFNSKRWPVEGVGEVGPLELLETLRLRLPPVEPLEVTDPLRFCRFDPLEAVWLWPLGVEAMEPLEPTRAL
jgi:hypothetical protein